MSFQAFVKDETTEKDYSVVLESCIFHPCPPQQTLPSGLIRDKMEDAFESPDLADKKRRNENRFINYRAHNQKRPLPKVRIKAFLNLTFCRCCATSISFVSVLYPIAPSCLFDLIMSLMAP